MWAAVAAAGRDIEQIVSFWADDAIVIPPGHGAIVGKNAIREYVTTSLKIPGFRIQWKTNRFTIAKACDLAYGIGTNEVSFDGGNGSRVTSRGNVASRPRASGPTLSSSADRDRDRCGSNVNE